MVFRREGESLEEFAARQARSEWSMARTAASNEKRRREKIRRFGPNGQPRIDVSDAEVCKYLNLDGTVLSESQYIERGIRKAQNTKGE